MVVVSHNRDTGDSPYCSNFRKDPVTGVAVPSADAPAGYIACQVGDLVPHITELYPQGFPCESANDDGQLEAPDYCSPWWETYGFFFGDGTHQTIYMNIEQIDFEVSLSFLRIYIS